MPGKLALALLLVLSAADAAAAGFAKPVVMMGRSQSAEDAELRFEPAPANTGMLIIHSRDPAAPSKPVRFVYDVVGDARPGSRGQPGGQPGGQTIDITFDDHQTFSLSCVPQSTDCHSSGYVTEDDVTFSILWRITQP